MSTIEAYDLGPKLGFEGVDNGILLFKNHVVPREAMLMKYTNVAEDGNVSGLGNASAVKYGYGSMLNLRVQLVFGFMLSGIHSPVSFAYRMLKNHGL